MAPPRTESKSPGLQDKIRTHLCVTRGLPQCCPILFSAHLLPRYPLHRMSFPPWCLLSLSVPWSPSSSLNPARTLLPPRRFPAFANQIESLLLTPPGRASPSLCSVPPTRLLHVASLCLQGAHTSVQETLRFGQLQPHENKPPRERRGGGQLSLPRWAPVLETASQGGAHSGEGVAFDGHS